MSPPVVNGIVELPCTQRGGLEGARACAVECDMWGGDLSFTYLDGGHNLCAVEVLDGDLGTGIEAFRCEAVCLQRPTAEASLAFEAWMAGTLFAASLALVALAALRGWRRG